MIFETHAHYDDARFDEDRSGLISSLNTLNIGTVINVGSTMESVKDCLSLAHEYPIVYAAIGVHPGELKGIDDEFIAYLDKNADDPKVCAVGEVGLDYHYLKEDYAAIEDETERKAAIEADKENQKIWLFRQLEVASKHSLPVIFHLRDAAADSMEVIEKAADMGIKGVLHCYGYSIEDARKYLSMGFYFGIGGSVTFKNSKKLQEVVKELPLERILTETDCPYLAPDPFRGSRNDSTYLPYIVKKIANLKEITEDEVIETTSENAFTLFSKCEK